MNTTQQPTRPGQFVRNTATNTVGITTEGPRASKPRSAHHPLRPCVLLRLGRGTRPEPPPDQH